MNVIAITLLWQTERQRNGARGDQQKVMILNF
jgi:hypothetical protein